MRAFTNIQLGFHSSCQSYSDARFDIEEHVLFPNSAGTIQCVDLNSSGDCDTYDVWIDPDRDAQGYCAQYNTWCHEVGHSLGLDDYTGVVDGTCMGAAADACTDPPRTWRYSDHDIFHLNNDY